ncbi:MAG: efflux RND transporter periplasmic adaptor subunit [Desulfomonile tiedjei]|uniref:Efflux RND transporter periplasmic adaptor subunit n=1 Tax=Desulfomonile tiedjei TaxID=2358 RepID=A0A9D6UZZ3_9BACT|nr:efflux RND transporter periplasmic adaptor subunit [Desulfomonile tiedjei]
MKKLLIALVIVFTIYAGYHFLRGNTSDQGAEVKYVTVPIEKGTLKAEINSTGSLKPRVEVQVGSQVSGTIKKLYADYESEVKEGQLIALIDPDTYKAKVGQAKANYQSAKANLTKAEVSLGELMRTLHRKQELVKTHAISMQEFDTAQANADSAQAQVEVAKAAVAQMEANLEEAELNLKYTRIVAPVNGVVTARNMDVGQTVTASFQTPVLFRIAEDLTLMQVYTSVDEADIGRVKVGQKATFSVPAFPDEVFSASVTQIRNDPQTQQNVVTYNVILDVNNNELKLRPGMTTNVQILLSEVHDALKVPDQAFRFSPKEDTGPLPNVAAPGPGQQRLWKLESKNHIRPVNVNVGVVGAERTQIFSDKLKSDDRVVIEAISKKKETAQGPAFRLRF